MIEFMMDNSWWMFSLLFVAFVVFIVRLRKNTVDDRVFEAILKILSEFGLNVRLTKNERKRVLDAVERELCKGEKNQYYNK